MRMLIRNLLVRALRKAGVGVYRIGLHEHRRFRYYGISRVIDVGANAGQFGEYLRKYVGFTGEIISFEPLSSAFKLLEMTACRDAKWKALNCGLGDMNGSLKINISANSASSSFLEILPACEAAVPTSGYISYETVNVQTLDSVFWKYCKKSDNVYLKIDTQGFEKQVLDGGLSVLPHIATVELELSLIPLYQDQMLFPEMCELMSGLGYTLVSLEPEFWDPSSGKLLQVNGTFHRY